jgi:hypothetical protein
MIVNNILKININKLIYIIKRMVYSYDTIVGISLKMNKETHKLDDSIIMKLNGIRKTLGIPVYEIIKKTVIQKKDADVGQITKLLNKITDKTYNKLKTEIFELIKSVEKIEDIYKLTDIIFGIVSSNRFYSEMYAKLYTELIKIKKEFLDLFQEHFDTYLTDLNKIEYISANDDYDQFCDYNKKIMQMESMLVFFINLMKNDICSLDNIAELCVSLQRKLLLDFETSKTNGTQIHKEQDEEMINCIYIVISECIDLLMFHRHMEEINENNEKIKSHSLVNSKIKFKCMDIQDIIKKN